MTKPRPPLSPHGALATIAILLGWGQVAAQVGRAESTVRQWGDPDTATGITFEKMLLLDTLFIEAGGGFRPFANAFAGASDLEDARVGDEASAIADAAALAAKEVGEAQSATFELLRPGAGDDALAFAEHQTAEAYEAQGRMLQVIRTFRTRLKGRQ